MKIKELEKLVEGAKYPEDIFGWDITRADAAKLFKKYRSLVHADKFEDDDMKDYVHEISVALNIQWKLALERFGKSTYGDKKVIVGATKDEYVINSKTASYTIVSTFPDANLCNVFKTQCGHVLKIARTHKDNDLLEAEAKILKTLHDSPKTVEFGADLISEFVESFKIKNDKMQKVVVNVFKFADDNYSIKFIADLHDGKFNPRHIIWMWKRILSVVGVIHNVGYVHGALVPSNVLISPANHGCRLIDFCYAVESGATLKVIDSQYADFYPPEITSEHHTNEVDSSFDIYMIGKLMIYLLGGDVKNNTLPDYVPNRMKNTILSTVIKNKYSRYKDAWEVYDIVSTLGKELYGAPKFVELKL